MKNSKITLQRVLYFGGINLYLIRKIFVNQAKRIISKSGDRSFSISCKVLAKIDIIDSGKRILMKILLIIKLSIIVIGMAEVPNSF